MLRKLSYGAPGLALGIPAIPLLVYLPVLYADNLGLGLTAVGLTIFTARLVDVVTDPVIGIYCNQFGQPRSEKANYGCWLHNKRGFHNFSSISKPNFNYPIFTSMALSLVPRLDDNQYTLSDLGFRIWEKITKIALKLPLLEKYLSW